MTNQASIVSLDHRQQCTYLHLFKKSDLSWIDHYYNPSKK